MPSAKRFSFGPKRYFGLQYLLPVGVTSRYMPRPSKYRSLGFPAGQVALRQATSVRGMLRRSNHVPPRFWGNFSRFGPPEPAGWQRTLEDLFRRILPRKKGRNRLVLKAA